MKMVRITATPPAFRRSTTWASPSRPTPGAYWVGEAMKSVNYVDTLGGLLDEEQFDRLRNAAERELASFVADGGVAFAMPALILTAGR